MVVMTEEDDDVTMEVMDSIKADTIEAEGSLEEEQQERQEQQEQHNDEIKEKRRRKKSHRGGSHHRNQRRRDRRDRRLSNNRNRYSKVDAKAVCILCLTSLLAMSWNLSIGEQLKQLVHGNNYHYYHRPLYSFLDDLDNSVDDATIHTAATTSNATNNVVSENTYKSSGGNRNKEQNAPGNDTVENENIENNNVLGKDFISDSIYQVNETFDSSSPSSSTELSSIQLSSSSYVSPYPNLLPYRAPPSNFTIITATSESHFLECISMLRSLKRVGYQGPIYLYMLRENGSNKATKEIKLASKAAISSSKAGPTNNNNNRNVGNEKVFKFLRALNRSTHLLNIEVIDFAVQEEIRTYCFKTQVIDDALKRAGDTLQIFFWTDTSTRFGGNNNDEENGNPQIIAQRMLQNNIDLTARTSALGMGENTHPATYQYLNESVHDYKDYYELASGLFFMNLSGERRRDEKNTTSVYWEVLKPWIDCGSHQHCLQCMTPPGSMSKHIKGRIVGPPSTKFLSHRQDQSVFSILVYKYQQSKRTIRQEQARLKQKYENDDDDNSQEVVVIGREPYIPMRTERRPDKDVKSFKALYET